MLLFRQPVYLFVWKVVLLFLQWEDNFSDSAATHINKRTAFHTTQRLWQGLIAEKDSWWFTLLIVLATRSNIQFFSEIFNALLCPSSCIFYIVCCLFLYRRFAHYIFHLPSGKNHLYEKGILLALPAWAAHFIAVKPSLRFGRNWEQRGDEGERWEGRGETEMMAQARLET